MASASSRLALPLKMVSDLIMEKRPFIYAIGGVDVKVGVADWRRGRHSFFEDGSRSPWASHPACDGPRGAHLTRAHGAGGCRSADPPDARSGRFMDPRNRRAVRARPA